MDLCNDIWKNQNKKQKKSTSDQGDKRIGPCQRLEG